LHHFGARTMSRLETKFLRELIESWIEYRINRELIPIRSMPHPYEFALYYDA